MYYCVNEKSDNEIWQVVHESAGLISEFDLKFVLDFSRSTCPSSGFSFLEDDTELTDFELRGVDGSVHVHKAVLAGFSPVMKTMLNGQWKETKEGAIEIPNTSKETLQHLKDYMYKQRIPATGVEKLAALASCYLMSDLEDRCTIQLLSTLSSTNLTDLLSFSVKHNMEKLMLAILENVQNGVVKVDDMKERYCEKLKESLLKKIFDN
ncbi:BTB/POZ domain-containing protein [Phthorimaea operculella]|nr:BTB/POZ domain-containing protein [Phthorimaea operculella]